jgi:hypothetical protein
VSASSKRLTRRAARLALVVQLALAGAGVESVARAEGRSLDCPSSSEEGQRLRDKNKYSDARAMFRACSQPSCPAIVRKDCTKWLSEIDETQPSIVIAAQDATGADLSAVKVLLDDRQVATKADGSSIVVDPGEHSLRVEAPGHAPLTQRLIVRVSEKNRLVRVVFQDGAQAAAPVAVGPPRASTETSAPSSSSSSGSLVLPLVLTGVGVLALGSFGYFGVTSKSDLSKLRTDCAPYCAGAQLDDVKSRMLIADVSLGVGIVALGVAAVLFATRGIAKSATTTATR